MPHFVRGTDQKLIFPRGLVKELTLTYEGGNLRNDSLKCSGKNTPSQWEEEVVDVK